MTASFDHVGPDLSFPHLEFPDWLPGPVADEAKRLYDGILRKNQQREPLSAERRASVLKEIELLSHLVTDNRMANVWRELYRKKRECSNEFLNPARRMVEEFLPLETSMPFIHDSKNQDWASRQFLDRAFSFAIEYSPLPKQKEIKSREKPFSEMATRLRQDAQSLTALGFREFACDLESMAIVCERNTNRPLPDTVVKRSRGDEVLRTYIFRLSMHCRENFEKWLPGTVATTAEVVFSKEIAGGTVRDIMRAATKRPAARSKAGSKRSKRPRELIEEFSIENGNIWAAAIEERYWQQFHRLPTNEQMMESMASAKLDALCDQHGGDPNFDEKSAREHCLEEAREIVLDKFYQRLYRA